MSAFAPMVLPPLTALYAAITRARTKLYERGLLRQLKLDAPVISVGNITSGGTGKTPLVAWAARKLAEEGRKVCILTRGYRRQNPKSMVIVSDGNEVRANAREAGDEAFLLGKKLTGIAAVISNIDRKAAGDWAIRELGTNAFVLDDGFQHLGLYRDLDLLTVDATNPWGNGFLLPSGRLREPLSSMRRAGGIVLTRTEQERDVQQIVTTIEKHAAGVPIFYSTMRTCGFSDLNSRSGSADPKSPAAAFCGIGNPNAFFKQLELQGFALTLRRAFADHHEYTLSELQQLDDEARRQGALSVITTEKDAVKLQSATLNLSCYVMEIEIVIENESDLVEMIRASLK